MSSNHLATGRHCVSVTASWSPFGYRPTPPCQSSFIYVEIGDKFTFKAANDADCICLFQFIEAKFLFSY